MTQPAEKMASLANAPPHQSASMSCALPLAMALVQCLRAQLPDMANYIEGQALQIVEDFKTLSSQSMEHSQQIQEVIGVVRHIELNGEVIPYERSIEILYEPLAQAIDKILDVSRLSMTMVMNIGNAAENVTRIESCIEQVYVLTKQTNMLAMNTQIEAARTGATGNSFRIIAQEVKALSERIKAVSDEIQMQIRDVSGSVRRSSELVDSLAHYDMTENLELKERVDELIASIMEQNKEFTTLLERASAQAHETANAISQLVVGIQFQDRSSQILGDFGSILDQVMELLKKEHEANMKNSAPAAAPLPEAIIEPIIDDIRLSDMRTSVLQALCDQHLLHASSDLAQRHLSARSGAGLYSTDASADEDIELF